MTEEIKNMLLERKKREKTEQGLVFPDKNGKTRSKVSRTFERVVKKLGLNNNITDPRDKVVFHTLRHTFASWLVMQGTPIYTVKEPMGHKTLAMTERYIATLHPTRRNKQLRSLCIMMININRKNTIPFL